MAVIFLLFNVESVEYIQYCSKFVDKLMVLKVTFFFFFGIKLTCWWRFWGLVCLFECLFAWIDIAASPQLYKWSVGWIDYSLFQRLHGTAEWLQMTFIHPWTHADTPVGGCCHPRHCQFHREQWQFSVLPKDTWKKQDLNHQPLSHRSFGTERKIIWLENTLGWRVWTGLLFVFSS